MGLVPKLETSQNLRIKNLSPQILNFNRLLLGLVPKLETSENLRIKNLSPQILNFNRLLWSCCADLSFLQPSPGL